jgi:hypothetical protein
MRVEIRTLTRTICALVFVALLAVGASARPHHRHNRLLRHDNGRHLGWTRGRHVGWSHSHHYGVRRNDGVADIFGRHRRNDSGVILRRSDPGVRGERLGVGRGIGVGRGVGHGRGRP